MTREPGPHCPLCSASVITEPAGSCHCDSCGVVFSDASGRLTVDPVGTRAALFAAADACAGGPWTLWGVLGGSEVTEPGLVAAYRRLALAEAGVAALTRWS